MVTKLCFYAYTIETGYSDSINANTANAWIYKLIVHTSNNISVLTRETDGWLWNRVLTIES